jgi:hypothetical protein
VVFSWQKAKLSCVNSPCVSAFATGGRSLVKPVATFRKETRSMKSVYVSSTIWAICLWPPLSSRLCVVTFQMPKLHWWSEAGVANWLIFFNAVVLSINSYVTARSHWTKAGRTCWSGWLNPVSNWPLPRNCSGSVASICSSICGLTFLVPGCLPSFPEQRCEQVSVCEACRMLSISFFRTRQASD